MPIIQYIIRKETSYVLQTYEYFEDENSARNKLLRLGGFLQSNRGGVSLISYSPENSKVTLQWYSNFGYGNNHLNDNHLRICLNLNSNGHHQRIYVKSYDNVISFSDLIPFFNHYFINPSDELIQELYDIALQKLACYRNVNLTGSNVVIDQYNSTFVDSMEAKHDLDKARLNFLWDANKLKTSLDLYQVENKVRELMLLDEKRREILGKVVEGFNI